MTDLDDICNNFEKALKFNSEHIEETDPLYPLEVKTVVKELKTEDTGKMFEMAICKAYDIPYDGSYKYSMDLPNKLQPRLQKLPELFPKCTHTANKQSRYDFTANDHTCMYLSAKTVKKGSSKVAPQVIGQANPKKFSNILGITYTSDADLKCYMQDNVTDILKLMMKHTFDCPNIYYHQEKDIIRYITMIDDIDWSQYEYEWTKNHKEWNNSTICKIKTKHKSISITEFQFHSKTRHNMAIRWFYDNILEFFKGHFKIVTL
jgi:hypothetical protein